jgi:hypothetical protein
VAEPESDDAHRRRHSVGRVVIRHSPSRFGLCGEGRGVPGRRVGRLCEGSGSGRIWEGSIGGFGLKTGKTGSFGEVLCGVRYGAGISLMISPVCA